MDPALAACLHATCINHRLLQEHMARGVDLEQTSSTGMTALKIAIMKDDMEAVDILVTAGASIHSGLAACIDYRTSYSIVSYLIEHGLDPLAYMVGSRSIISHIAWRHWNVIFFRVVSKGVDIYSYRPGTGTLFEWAVLAQNTAVVAFLLQAGYDKIDHSLAYSSYDYLAMRTSVPIVRMMIDHGIVLQPFHLEPRDIPLTNETTEMERIKGLVDIQHLIRRAPLLACLLGE